MLRSLLPILSALFCGLTSVSANPADEALAAYGIEPERAGFLIVRLSDGEQWAAGDRIDERRIPASTSKIPHTLVALAEGIAGPDTVFEWDGVPRFLPAWNQDQTLTTAFRRSALWVYQDIAAAAGRPTMARYLSAFDYGNGDVGTDADLQTYWLRGPLEITVREQVVFLTRLSQRALDLPSAVYDQAFEIMTIARGDDWRLYAKTGWAALGDRDLGWYVGWVESAGDTFVFALTFDMADTEADISKRPAIVHHALRALGIDIP